MRAVKGALAAAKINSSDILGIGVSGHGKGLYMLGKNGEEIYNGIVSTDNRAVKYQAMFEKNGVAEKIYETNYQKILAFQPVCLLRWFKDNEPEIYNKIGYVISVKDYIRYRLTGNINVERTDVSGSNLINLTTGKKDKNILKLFGIEEMFECIPEIKNSNENCGTVTDKAAEETGLSADTVVSGGMFDIDACALSMGITDAKNICVIAGTWSINEFISDKLIRCKSMNSYYCIPGYYLIEECSPTSAGNLEWYLNIFGIEKDYNKINEAVESVKAEDSKAVFLPFVYASNEENLGLQGTFANLTASTTKAELLRAVYEGIVFSHKSHLDKLLSLRGNDKSMRLTGGAANSDVWAQMFADCMGLNVETIADKEHGCFGAAISAGIACGMFSSEKSAADKFVKIEKIYKPNKDLYEIYQSKYKNYRKLISALNNYYEV